MISTPRFTAFLAAFLLMSVGLAQDDQNEDQGEASDPATITLEVAESDQYGPYLVDDGGRELYLFLSEEAGGEGDAERQTEGVRDSAGSCTSACQEDWTPVIADQARAGSGIDQELVYTAEADVPVQLVFNGWPLYYFGGDAPQESLPGQGDRSHGGVWYLVSPEGVPILELVEDMDQPEEDEPQEEE